MTAEDVASGQGPGSVTDALRVMDGALDYLNGPDGAAALEAAAVGGVLASLGGLSGKFAAARSAVLAGSTRSGRMMVTGTGRRGRGWRPRAGLRRGRRGRRCG